MSHRRTASDFNEGIAVASSVALTQNQSRPRQSTNEPFDDTLVRGTHPHAFDGTTVGVSSMSVDSPTANGLISAGRRSSITNMDAYRMSESYDSEGSSLKDYANDCPVEEFIGDVAALVNRPAEKAQEWLIKLKSEDILTVGDLRNLLEEDWQRLNLTVFATRVVRNALRGRVRLSQLDLMSPRVSGKIGDTSSAG